MFAFLVLLIGTSVFSSNATENDFQTRYSNTLANSICALSREKISLLESGRDRFVDECRKIFEACLPSQTGYRLVFRSPWNIRSRETHVGGLNQSWCEYAFSINGKACTDKISNVVLKLMEKKKIDQHSPSSVVVKDLPYCHVQDERSRSTHQPSQSKGRRD